MEDNQKCLQGAQRKNRFQGWSSNKVKFWTNKWCGDTAFRDLFLTLYSIASSKNAWVKDVWDNGSWSPRFVR